MPKTLHLQTLQSASGPSGEISQKDVTFKWTGSDDETATSDLIYSYKLEGKDDSWSNWTYNTSKSYSDLLAGGYIFKVKAKDEAGNVDPTPDSRSFTTANAEPGSIRWSLSTNKSDMYAPAIGEGGTVYTGVTNYSYDDEGWVYAIHPDGTIKWTYRIRVDDEDVRIYSSPTVASGGTVYIGLGSYYVNELHAVNPNGSFEWKWEFGTGNDVRSSPAIASDGTVYVGSDDDTLYALNSDGTEKWSFAANSKIRSSPAIGADGTIYVGSRSGKFYAIGYNGDKKWEYQMGGNGWTPSPAIAGDGTIYVSSPGGNLYALNPDSTKEWVYYGEGKMSASSPVVGPEGKVFIGAKQRGPVCYQPRWH